MSEDLFLHIGLLVENTKFVVSIYQLDSSVIPILTNLLVAISQSLHVSLQRKYNHIQLLRFLYVLVYHSHLLFVLILQFVQLGLHLVPVVLLQLKHPPVLQNSPALLSRLIL